MAGRLLQPVPRPPGRRPLPQLGRRAAHRRPECRRSRRGDHLPEHRATVLPDRNPHHLPCHRPRRVRAAPRRDPYPQPLAPRLVRRVPRTPLRPAPGVPQRPRRHDRRPRVDGRERLPELHAPGHPARHGHPRLLGPDLRSPLGSGARPRPDRHPARRFRRPRLREGPDGDPRVPHGGAVLRPPQPVAPDHVGRLRAVPRVALRHDRAGRGLGARRLETHGRLPRPDVVGPGRRTRIRRRTGASHEAQRVLRPKRLDRRQLPESVRGRGHPRGGRAQRDVGQRLPAQRGHVPPLP